MWQLFWLCSRPVECGELHVCPC